MPPIVVVVILFVVVIFVVFPKIKNSKWAARKFEDMTSDGYKQNSTSDLIENISDAKDGLKQKSVEAIQTIKDATKENETIDKVLGRDKKE